MPEYSEIPRPIKPAHYDFKIQPWDVIHDWRLGFFEGNAVKYICRSGNKNGNGNKRSDDLRKAIENLYEEYNKEIEREEKPND